MATKYLVRLDDACPTMDKNKWLRIQDILYKYDVKPMVGIIPNNKYPKLIIDEPYPFFWDLCKEWQKRNWAIALHGYDHLYMTKKGGIHPVNSKSEFAGVPLDIQKKKIRKGYSVLVENGITPQYFFAPAHSFDENTITALLDETPIRKISDTVAFKPYKYRKVSIYPQQMGHFRNINISGYWTFCFHPNTMVEKDFEKFEEFIKKNKKKFISFDDITDISNSKTLLDKLLSRVYFLLRKINKVV